MTITILLAVLAVAEPTTSPTPIDQIRALRDEQAQLEKALASSKPGLRALDMTGLVGVGIAASSTVIVLASGKQLSLPTALVSAVGIGTGVIMATIGWAGPGFLFHETIDQNNRLSEINAAIDTIVSPPVSPL